ncbi:matrix metalloproteinase-14-like [Oppia nitens]|uniref:matrix metalloproteinase-14-like n=1 Tax=Oppia nitens TaxID=1686743 RepID=UPI0023DA4D50|nr:matrix metalloproteinase-14-like [Oppia nitens]
MNSLIIIVFIIAIIVRIGESYNDENQIESHGMYFPMSVHSENDAMKYLNQFGYMEKMPINMTMSSPQMKPILTDYQRFMGIQETGVLDENTMRMMNEPRCGVKDNILSQTLRPYNMKLKKRLRRYSLQGSMWQTKNITWKVTQYSTQDNLREKDKHIDKLMKYALHEWSKHSGLNFIHERGDKKAMIEIGFKVMDHRDGNPFDGPGRTLAHAFFPQFGGNTHFDDHERWSIDGKRGVDLLSVAVHEFGHALGLGHSDNKDSLMYPTYAGKRSELKKDDINGIQMLYGPNDQKDTSYLDVNERRIPKVLSSAPDLCTDFRIDAADCNALDECFFFRDEYIWRINDDTGVYPGYPKRISDIFPGVIGKVDAVITDQNSGRTYIFKKNKVWVFKEPMNKPIRAKDSINNLIRGLDTNSLDAATRWGFNGKIYLFKDDKYWRYEPERVSYPINRRYPQSTQAWRGLPDKIDAAMFWPKTGKTYFFSGSQYYRFNDIISSVDSANPPFPRDASKWWLKCQKSSFKSDLMDNKDNSQLNESNDPSGQPFFEKISKFKTIEDTMDCMVKMVLSVEHMYDVSTV